MAQVEGEGDVVLVVDCVFILDVVIIRDEDDEKLNKAEVDGDAVTLGVIEFVRDVVAVTLGHED